MQKLYFPLILRSSFLHSLTLHWGIVPLLWLLLTTPLVAFASIEKNTTPRNSSRDLPCKPENDISVSTACEQATDGSKLPRLLSNNDVFLYRLIFESQKRGEWSLADQAIAGLENDVLLGHVLYQRYMHPRSYRSKFGELNAWLKDYADHPGNTAIRKLALKRRPTKQTFIYKLRHPVPKNFRAQSNTEGRKVRLPYKARKVHQKIRSMVQRGSVTLALNYAENTQNRKTLTLAGYALSLGDIARGYYRYHKWDKAVRMAHQLTSLPITSSAFDVLDAYWWGGLAAWRQKNYALAAEFFEKFALPIAQSNTEKAQGYYWSALAFILAGFPEQSTARLQNACGYSLAFYGYLACEALAIEPRDDQLKNHLPTPNPDVFRRTIAMAPVKRARALLEIGNYQLAMKELRPFSSVYVEIPVLKSIALLAHRQHLPYINYLAARSILKVSGDAFLPSLYPQPLWTPVNGYQIDKAIVYAVIRQESHFNPFAKSPKKASGLMQVIPSTATFIGGKKYRKKNLLYIPEESIHLGQSYLQWLLDLPKVEGDLLRALVAYNGGPGNFKLWQKKIAANTLHPLLYIESLPPRETRKYVKSVLLNVWIYRSLMAQSKPSLAAILNNTWPLYKALDDLDVTAGDPVLSLRQNTNNDASRP